MAREIQITIPFLGTIILKRDSRELERLVAKTLSQLPSNTKLADLTSYDTLVRTKGKATTAPASWQTMMDKIPVAKKQDVIKALNAASRVAPTLEVLKRTETEKLEAVRGIGSGKRLEFLNFIRKHINED